jgi:cytochrome c oxidase assembly protein subunit 15
VKRVVSPERYRQITLVALIALIGIIITGGAVRLTGSGLGCPDWPTCSEGRLVSEFRTTPEIIEFVNRMITFVVSAAVAAAVLGSRWRQPYRRDLVLLSWGLVAGVVAQVVLGGVTVLMELTPPTVMGHFLLSQVLVTNAVVLRHRAGEPDGGVRRRAEPPLTIALGWVMVALTAAVHFMGTVVTGTGPHGGDPDVDRLDFAIADVTRIHAILGLSLAAVVLVLLARTGRGWPVVAAIAAQITIGYIQYFNGVPEVLVGLHLLGATLVLITVLQLHLSFWAVEPAASPEAADDRAGVEPRPSAAPA